MDSRVKSRKQAAKFGVPFIPKEKREDRRDNRRDERKPDNRRRAA